MVRSVQEQGHECDRFGLQGIPCPFRKFKEDEDEDPEEQKGRIPFELAIPARRAKDFRDQLRPVVPLAVAPKELREALERMAAFQQEGDMLSIPDFPLSGRGHPEIIATLTAIALMTAFRQLRGSGSGTASSVVRAGERRVAQGLAKVAKPLGFSPGQGRTMGRGGIHVNAAADLRRLIFGRRRLKRPGGVALGFGQEFNETGF